MFLRAILNFHDFSRSYSSFKTTPLSLGNRMPCSRESLVSRTPGSRESPVSRTPGLHYFILFLNFKPTCLQFGHCGFLKTRCPGRRGVTNTRCLGTLGSRFLSVHCFFKLQPLATAFKQQSIRNSVSLLVIVQRHLIYIFKKLLTSLFLLQLPVSRTLGKSLKLRKTF